MQIRKKLLSDLPDGIASLLAPLQEAAVVHRAPRSVVQSVSAQRRGCLLKLANIEAAVGIDLMFTPPSSASIACRLPAKLIRAVTNSGTVNL